MKVLAVIILVIFALFSIALIMVVCFGDERRREVSMIAHTINAVVCIPVEIFMILFLCGLH